MTSEPKLYELAYVLKNEPEETLRGLVGKIREYIEEKSGRTLEEGRMAKRRLSYPIRKEAEGYFGHLKFFLKAGDLAELEEKLRQEKNILRYLLAKAGQPEQALRPTVRKIRKIPEKKALDTAEIDRKLEEILGA